MSEKRKTYCRNCSACCGLVLDIAGDRIVSLRGDQNHPVTEGYFCVKGRASADWQNGEDRLITTMARMADGSHASIDTAQALDEINERLETIVAERGPRAVALYYGTGVKMNTLGSMALRSWLKELGSPYLYSSSTVDQSAKWVTAARMGMFATGTPRIDEADVIMIVGRNPRITHTGPMSAGAPEKRLRQAKARGTKLIVIDPRRTETARHADLHLAIYPGEDAWVLAAMIRTILQNGWEDREFCERYVTSLQRLRQAVDPFTPDRAGRRARLDPAQIVEAAEMFATARRKGATSGTGLDMSRFSNTTEHLLEALNAICGGYRRAGDVVNKAGTAAGTGMSEGVIPPCRTWEEGPKLWTESTGLVGGEFPSSRIPNEIEAGGLRALVVVGGNLASALGQPEKTLAALAKLDLLVVIDSRMTATALRADYVIPTKLPYERYDASLAARHVYPFAQLAVPVVNSPQGVMEDWEVFWELSRRAGGPLSLIEYKWGGGVGRELPLPMGEKPTSEDLIRWFCESAGFSFEELLVQPGGIALEFAPVVVQPASTDNGARLDVCPEDVASEIAAIVNRAESDPEKYRLTVRRMIETMNSAFRDSSITRSRHPQNFAFMNPSDMTDEGLSDFDSIEIRSAAGVIVGKVRGDQTVRAGVVSMSHQWGTPWASNDPQSAAGAFTGRLVSLDNDLESINYMPMQSGVPVDIRALSEQRD